MKTLNTLITILICTPLMAQIPNSGFENWEQKTIFGTTFTDPQGWLSINYANAIENIPAAATATTDAYSGNFALKLTNTESEDKLAASISTMKLNGMEFIDKFPLTYRSPALKGYLKYEYNDKDTCIISVTVFKNGSVIGSGDLQISTEIPTYEFFSVPIMYWDADTTIVPDSAFILMQAGQNSSREVFNAGVSLYIDELSFAGGPTTGIHDAASAQLAASLYPNPTQDMVVLSLETSSKPTIEVYDITGKQYTIEHSEVSPAKHEIYLDPLPKGMYFIKVMAGNQYRTFRVLVQ